MPAGWRTRLGRDGGSREGGWKSADEERRGWAAVHACRGAARTAPRHRRWGCGAHGPARQAEQPAGGGAVALRSAEPEATRGRPDTI